MPGLEAARYHQIERVGSAHEVLENSLDGSGQGALFDTGPSTDLDGVAAEIAAWEREGMRLVTILDEDYPLYLRLVHQRPPLLFLRGRLVDDDLGVAVVSSGPTRRRRRRRSPCVTP
ncbi:hypothetical protein [Streptomyces sp. NPDC059575]|uniref:hypothetical protein n=1 Tax=Streptomyces sp. NPDC059575 TaxID=3346872 RepID=UPI0036AD92F6